MKQLLLTLTLAAMATAANGQSLRGQLRQGNRDYDKQRYEQAETAYRHALQSDSTDSRGNYNLGSSLYRQEKYAEADSFYRRALQSPSLTGKQRAMTLHN